MTKPAFALSFILSLHASACSTSPEAPDNTDPQAPEFAGAYLGQPTPGAEPIRFATGSLMATTSRWWHDAPVFSPDGLELYLTFYDTEATPAVGLRVMRMDAAAWSAPQYASFSGEFRDNSPRFSIDGERLFFTSRRAGGALFVVHRTGGTWSAVEPVSIPGVTSNDFVGISITRNETVYFGDVNSDHLDLFRSARNGEQYDPPENLGTTINSDAEEWGPFIDSDEDFIIFSSNRQGGYGLHDLYVSFRNGDGSWTEPQNMGASVNTAGDEASPLITPDGSYLFFLSQKPGDAGLNPYWVGVGIVDGLRPPESTGTPETR